MQLLLPINNLKNNHKNIFKMEHIWALQVTKYCELVTLNF